MQLIKKKERPGEYAFYIGVAIHLLLMTIGYGDYAIPFHGRFMQVAFGLFCIKILTTYYSRNEWIAIFTVGFLGVLSYVVTGDEYIVSVIVMIFAAKNVDMRPVCRWILTVSLIFTVGIAIFSLTGVGGELYEVRDFGRGGVETRWCLGFGHANNLHGTVWYIVTLIIYLYFEKLDWRHYLALTLGNAILFNFTVSKGGLIAVQIMIIAAFLLRYIRKLSQQTWIYICGFLGMVGVFLISIISVSVKWTESTVLMFLDRIFTGRINLAYQHANIGMWKMLSSAGEFGDTVDNGWVTIFFHYGYVIGILFALFQVYLIYRIWKEQNGVLLAIVVTCAFYTFMEATYTMNSAYLLCNLSYIAAMILLSRTNVCIQSEHIE